VSRVLVIGLDCVPPALAFDRYRDLMPNLAALASGGSFGPLRSTFPPITVPAWTSMVSGRDPGELGLYGFRNRVPHSYALEVATSADVRVKRVWDRASEAGKRVAALFVPLTSPPPAVLGSSMACFLWPGTEPLTFPPSLRGAIEGAFGPYRSDIPEYRSEDRARILDELFQMARQHFAIARDLWTRERPDLAMMVEIGPDRLHHAFWQFMDPTHPRFDRESEFSDAGRRYYAMLDAEIGAFIDALDDDTSVIVASDHGAKALHGGVRVNEWLRRNGWLTLRDSSATTVSEETVDWSKTRAWSTGGYYGRVFMNVRGRDPLGVIEASDYERVRTELADALGADLARVEGVDVGARVVRPEDLYRRVRGLAPDLLMVLGDLRFRALGTLDASALFSPVNDSGPDGCNHDWDGIFVMRSRHRRSRGALEGLEIYDVGATILDLLGLERPPELLGRPVA
jgi:predicted AlkP superfamily phosphohydrolase/phosphomutase